MARVESEAPSMTHHLYAYGTLQNRAVIALIVGRELVGHPARLAGYARYRVIDRVYPAIVAAPASEVDGVLYSDVDEREVERLDLYEGDLYERLELPVRVGDRVVIAHCYVLRSEHGHRLSSEPWDLAAFERDHLANYLARVSLTARAP
jgi:gamma-glutamylcyclotransferase (GGCT)/AIG2-like uncharacterized protein YtfP